MLEIINSILNSFSLVASTSQSLSTGITLFSLFTSIAYIYTTYRLFEKAGENGWSVFVPVYNAVVYMRISSKPFWMFFLQFLCLIAASSPVSTDANSILRLVLLVLFLVITIYIYVGFIKQYDGSVIFWIFYTFLPIIAAFLVKKVEYTGGIAKVSYTQAPLPRYPSYSRPAVTTPQDSPVSDQNGPTDNSNTN